ncbi:MAG: hypothetical protein QM784_28955 [Polyangiaceae bacterium]
MLRQSANLLLLDEPTNDLDVQTLGSLETMLVEQGITALVVTHDRWFLDRVATAILAFEGDGKVVLYPGNFDTYRRLRAEAELARAKPSTPAPAEGASKPEPARKNKKAGLNFRDQKELDALPAEIDQLDATITELTEKLSDPATYTSGRDAVTEIQKQLDVAKAELEQKMARWEELELKKTTAT